MGNGDTETTGEECTGYEEENTSNSQAMKSDRNECYRYLYHANVTDQCTATVQILCTTRKPLASAAVSA